MIKFFSEFYKPPKQKQVIVNSNALKHYSKLAEEREISKMFFDKHYPEIEEMNDRQLITEFVTIRNNLKIGTKIKSSCDNNASQSSSSSKYKDVIHSLNYKIQELKYLSLYILYIRFKRTGYTEIDLHYLHLDEAEQLVESIIEELQVFNKM